MRFLYRLIPVAVLLVLTTCNSANACSCVRNGPPCGSYGAANAVFLGRVVGSVEQKTVTDEDGTKTVYDVGRIRFLVLENFKGVPGYEVEIHSGTGGGDCGYWFLRNETYVVYAYNSSEDNKLYTGICTRTRHLVRASEDLDFLRGLSAAKPGGTLYGKLIRYLGDREHGPYEEGAKLAGIKISITGATKNFEAVTNADGDYKITGLPAGDYDALPQLPANLGATASHDTVDRFGSYSGHRPVTISDRGCAEMSFSVEFNGLVSGKVTDAKGEPVKDMRIDLALEADLKKDWSAWTNEEGRYEFHLVQPGHYLLGLNLRWVPDQDHPYPRTYYPGVSEKSEAALITVGEGEKLKGYDLVLPPRLPDRELKIAVVWPDGRPAANASLSYDLADYPGSSIGQALNADEKGMVVVRLFDNQRYILVANGEISPDKDVHSEPIEVLVAKAMKPLKLVLTKPGYESAGSHRFRIK